MPRKSARLQSGPSLWGTDIPLVDYEPPTPSRRYLPMVEADALSGRAMELVPGFTYRELPTPRETITYAKGTCLERFDGYEIMRVNPASNRWAAQGLKVPHTVSLSGGLGSAVAAERVIRRFGRDQVLLWFADVLKENRDLYRFLHDLLARWGGRLYYYADGRRPEDVWDRKKLIPNNMVAPCSYELKVGPFRDFIQAMERLPIVYIGYKAGEDDRMCTTAASYREAIPQAVVDYPLLWIPAEVRDLAEVCEQELGIEVPLLYRLGYDYNNCFAGETRYITSQGVKSLHETAGRVVEVLSGDGAFIPAEIKCFGKQPLFALTVERHGRRKVIYSTPGHRWICYAGGRVQRRWDKRTCDLVAGDRLVPMFARGSKRIRPPAPLCPSVDMHGLCARSPARKEPLEYARDAGVRWRRDRCWTVVSAEPTGRAEEVYCAVVPGTHCFTLEDNILTGNCGGECCRAGITSWVRTRECFPQRFDHSQEWEEEARSHGDYRAGHAMCGRERNGKKEALPLAVICQEYVPQAARLYRREATAHKNRAEKLRELYGN